jgi:uncharacterized membrane protein
MDDDLRRTALRLLFSPTSLVLGVLLGALLGVIVVATELALIEYAYRKIGIQPRYLFALLVGSFVGGAVNIPVARLRGERLPIYRETRAFGVIYRLPDRLYADDTIVAVNVGGALIPLGVSSYLLWSAPGTLVAPLAVTALVAGVVHRLARPMPGFGIAVPLWIPPLVAAAAALLLAPEAPARAAYVGGTLGALIGGDLLNLAKLRGLGAPVASIGGAGTFDGIFLTGLAAALLA